MLPWAASGPAIPLRVATPVTARSLCAAWRQRPAEADNIPHGCITRVRSLWLGTRTSHAPDTINSGLCRM